MSIDVVHRFLELPADVGSWNSDAWELVRDRSTFLNVDWGLETDEIINQWNSIFPSHQSLSAVPDDAPTQAGFTHHLRFGDSTLDIPYEASREDCMIVVLSINKLTKKKIEIRLCIDSTGNSDWSFLPLAPGQWGELEESYGPDLIAKRFVPLPDEWQDLNNELSSRGA